MRFLNRFSGILSRYLKLLQKKSYYVYRGICTIPGIVLSEFVLSIPCITFSCCLVFISNFKFWHSVQKWAYTFIDFLNSRAFTILSAKTILKLHMIFRLHLAGSSLISRPNYSSFYLIIVVTVAYNDLRVVCSNRQTCQAVVRKSSGFSGARQSLAVVRQS